MTKQLSFLQKIDRIATQKKLEGVLENVRLYRQFGMMREEMKVTPSYEIRYHGPTNDVAMVNIQQSKREEWIKQTSFRIDQFLSRLGNGRAGKDQRDIIIKRYLEDEDVCDYMVYSEIGMSVRIDVLRLEYFKEKSLRNYILFIMGINTGLRISDILKLKVGDVKGSHISIREKKTGKQKRIQITAALKRELKWFIEEREDSEYLLQSRQGRNRPIVRSMAYKI